MENIDFSQFATKKELADLRKEMRKGFDFAYKKFTEIDERFNQMDSKLDKTIHSIQQMCDKVLKAHENFSVESLAIKDNYQQLETRVTKVEKVVFPNSSVA